VRDRDPDHGSAAATTAWRRPPDQSEWYAGAAFYSKGRLMIFGVRPPRAGPELLLFHVRFLSSLTGLAQPRSRWPRKGIAHHLQPGLHLARITRNSRDGIGVYLLAYRRTFLVLILIFIRLHLFWLSRAESPEQVLRLQLLGI